MTDEKEPMEIIELTREISQKVNNEVEKAAKKALSKKEESGLLTYEEAEKLVEIFTDVQDVTAIVRVEFEKLLDRAVGRMPDAPSVKEILIDYYMFGDESEDEKNYLLQLGISKFEEFSVDDVPSVEFSISTSVEETDKKERLELCVKRGELMTAIARKLDFIQHKRWRKCIE